ncbi:MAG: hypothetical protein F6K31_42750, partial [Symploca sp. SIO2G7]|nr:hypothetical protein [Symploca sp. SIO2G7]
MADPVAIDTGNLREVAAGTARLMFYALLAIVLMTLDVRGAYVQRIQWFAGSLAEPLLLVVDWPFAKLRVLSNLLENRVDLLQRQQQYEREIQQLRAGLSVVSDLARENVRLRELLDTRERL